MNVPVADRQAEAGLVIDHIDTWILEFPQNREHRDFHDAPMELIGVTLTSKDGVTGFGYSWTVDWRGGKAVKALLDEVLTPMVIGRSALDIKEIWKEFWRSMNRLGKGVTSMAIAAMDIALWDVVAKSVNLPLARVLGQIHDRVPTYSSGRFSPSLDLSELVDISLDTVEKGFEALKLRVGLDPRADIARVSKIRETVGAGIKIMTDANQRLDLPTASWLGKQFEQLDVFWFEEPLPNEYVSGYQQLQGDLSLPIASGEHLFSLWDFKNYLDRKAISIVQPDVCMVGGITEWLRISELAYSAGAAMSPHFVPEFHIHLAAASPSAIYVESFPMMDDLLEHQLVVKNGHVEVPDRPGHGLAFQDWVWEKYRVA